MNKAQLSALLATALTAAGVGYTGAQLTATTEAVQASVRDVCGEDLTWRGRRASVNWTDSILSRHGMDLTESQKDLLDKYSAANDCSLVLLASAAKAQAAADALDQYLLANDPNFIPEENGLRNLATKVATASNPSGPVVAYAARFRATSKNAETLKTRADQVAGVKLASIGQCNSDALWGSFDIPSEDGGMTTEQRPYRDIEEFLSSQQTPLVRWVDPSQP